MSKKPQTEIQKAMHWLLNANTGMSSECLMATMLNGGPVNGKDWKSRFSPADPSDFKRCVDLLNAVPEFREQLGVMKQVSKSWAVLVDHWDELEALLAEEILQRSAPKTYARMQELFKTLSNGVKT